MPVSGILGAGGKTGLGKRVIRDNLGPLGLRDTQVIHWKQGFRAWQRRLEVGGIDLQVVSSQGRKRSYGSE